ncbi:MAG: RHS repeat-associated core domain-containing protein [Planctomycetes bacterium]|nr:RHS repeat-associated core domain-containing protein [Planctomycetota bacterium]
MTSSAFQTPWSHTRTYSNQMLSNFNRGNGWNWSPAEWSYLAPTNLPGATLVLNSNLSFPRYFFQDPVTGLYSPMFGDLCTFVHQSGQFVLTERDGAVKVFHDFASATRPGEFVSQTSPGGNLLQVVQETTTRIVEVQQTQAGTTVSFLYQYGNGYLTSGSSSSESAASGGNLIGCISRVRMGTGLWQYVTQAVYTYYDGSSSHGNLNDLQTVTLQNWLPDTSSSSGAGGDWVDVSTEYYRYYTPDQSGGFVHGLRYVCLPQAYSDLAALVGDPLSASDAEVALFADYFYAYDDSDRAVLEQVKGGSQTYTLAFEDNPRHATSSSSGSSTFETADYNVWLNKTIETRPDGTVKIVYCNNVGLPMLSVLRQSQVSPVAGSSSGSSSSSGASGEWCHFYRFDTAGRPILTAEASAITGYDDTYDDLLNFNPVTGQFAYLKNDDGLIRLTNYYAASDAPQPEGYQKSEQIQQGQSGTPILLNSTTYETVTAGGITVHPIATQTQYPDASNPVITIQTSYAYTFHTGTVQPQQQTTTLPVISTSQNGSGVANTRKAYFDQLGYQLWDMDERGFITGTTYDSITGAVIQQIRDYDTSQTGNAAPTGWVTPTGGGLNLVTDMTVDNQGRTIQSLGPSHSIDLAGTVTTVRTASWSVFDDVNHMTYSGQGYATGTSPSYTCTLVNPVSITKMGPGGRVNEQIQATAVSTAGTLADIITAAGGGATAFPQSRYTRWTTTQYTDCCLAASQRVYHSIPSTGMGTAGTNYDETDYGYDVMKRPYRTVSPGGTITEQVYETRGLVTSVWIGTNDAGATMSDPSGGGADPANNMVQVTANEYDYGMAGGDGNLTQQTQYVDNSTTRVTAMTYDYRNRQLAIDGEIDYFAQTYYDNLNRIVKSERYDTTASGHLIARTVTNFDDLSRPYQTIQYEVDPATGTVGYGLTSNTWYDQTGHVIKSLPAGSSLFTKTTFDSLGRSVVAYRGYDLSETSYAGALTVTDDVILEQVETVYDAAGNAIQSTSRQRYHNAPATQTGALQDPNTTPKARVSYSAAWQDGIGRIVATANYGTNGGSALSRPGTVPSASDTVLVSLSRFDQAGNSDETVDPSGMITRMEFDDAGRTITQIDNAQSGSSSSSFTSTSTSDSSSSGGCSPSDDVNRTTRFTYTADGQQATLTAVNAQTGDQVTTWAYGTTLTDSDIASSQLLRSVTYPDSTSSSDLISYTYNRQGQQTTLTDQRGCVHTFDYDLLGRLIHDRVTTLGTGVDGAIQRLSTNYEVRGLRLTLTSYDNATVGSGSIVNQVQFAYNNFGQLTTDYQSHSGAVNTTSTPKVQLNYANGSANTIRPITLTYPNGRVLTYDYGTSGDISDAVSRIGSIVDDDLSATHLADYSYLGLASAVIVDYTQPGVEYILASLTGTNDPDTGDIYSGLNRFGRVKDCRWYDTGNSTETVRLQYGYDRVSNRLWRSDLVAQSLGKDFDELYAYDGLHRLQDMQRGALSSGHTSISSENFAQCWTLDSTSNWSGFREAASGGGWTLAQSRSANTVNEITGVTNTIGTAWVTPAYDLAGNTTTLPKPADPTTSFTGTYDAWNRLVALADATTTELVQTNQYDARMFRTARLDFTAGAMAETRHLYYSFRWQSLEERIGTSPWTASPERQQVWGLRYIDDLVVRDRDTNSDASFDERLYGLQDANWNMVCLIDEAALPKERYLYSPFGQPVILSAAMSPLSGSLFDSCTLFTGQHFDPQTQMSLFRIRWLDTLTGQFLTRDPLRYVVGANMYSCTFAVNDVDPYGLAPEAAPVSALSPSNTVDDDVRIVISNAIRQVVEERFGPTISVADLLPQSGLTELTVTVPPIVTRIPCEIILYAGHNTGVFGLMYSDFGSGVVQRDMDGWRPNNNTNMSVPCGTFVAGFGCGVSTGNAGQTASINDWISRNIPANSIPDVARSGDAEVSPQLATQQLRSGIDAATSLANKLKKKYLCGGMRCKSITIHVECDADYRDYLENSRWPDKNKVMRDNWPVSAADRTLCDYTKTIPIN